MAQVRRKQLEDGRILVVKEDGSTYVIDPATGSRQDLSGPNPSMAEAFGYGDTAALDQQLQAIEAYENSPAGQRANRLRQEAYDENVRQFNVGAGTQQYNAETNRQQANTGQYNAETGRLNAGTNQYSAETGRMDTEARIAELERRYGLDVAKFGDQYLQTSIAYNKTPRSWVDAVQYRAGATPIFQSIAAGKQLPAFGAASGQAPAMNNAGDTMASLGFNNSTMTGVNDTLKSVQQVLKAVPPGQSPAGTLSPAEIGAINLAQELYRGGGTNVAEGTWESMDRDAQDVLLGAMDASFANGGDAFLRAKDRTRIPRQSNVNAA